MTRSTPRKPASRRAALLKQLALAGRDMSDAAVLFHGVLAARLGLGPTDWKTLGLLERRGPMTAGELAAHSGMAPASVTGIIDRLERGGWVRRGRDPEDGRRVVVELDRTATGNAVGGSFAGLQRRLRALYRRYSDDELALLLELLREIARCQQEATAELSGET